MSEWRTRVCQGRQSIVQKKGDDQYLVIHLEHGVQVGEEQAESLTQGRMLASRHTFRTTR